MDWGLTHFDLRSYFCYWKRVPGLSSYEEISNSQLLAFCSAVALTGRLFLFRRSPNPVSLNFFIRFHIAILEQLKVKWYVQILLTFHPFSRKSFFMTAISSFAKIIILNYVRTRKSCQYENGSIRTTLNKKNRRRSCFSYCQ